MTTEIHYAARPSQSRPLLWVDYYLAKFISGDESLPDDQHMVDLVRAGLKPEVAISLPLIVARASRLFAIGLMAFGIFYYAIAHGLIAEFTPRAKWLSGDWSQGLAGIFTVISTLGTVTGIAANSHWEGLRLAQSLAVCLANLGALTDDQACPNELRSSSDMRERRKTIRARLRRRAWLITANVSVLVGRHRHERDCHPINATGRWLSWASEDLDDPVRLRGATYACIDLANHAFANRAWTPPAVVPPPEKAQLLKPIQLWLLEPMTRLRVAVVLLLPLVTALVSLVAKILG